MLQMGTYALGYVDTHHDSVEISEAPAPRRAIRVDHQHLRPSRMKLNGRPQQNRGVFRDRHNGGIPAATKYVQKLRMRKENRLREYTFWRSIRRGRRKTVVQ